jgi:hypothetical protein
MRRFSGERSTLLGRGKDPEEEQEQSDTRPHEQKESFALVAAKLLTSGRRLVLSPCSLEGGAKDLAPISFVGLLLLRLLVEF